MSSRRKTKTRRSTRRQRGRVRPGGQRTVRSPGRRPPAVRPETDDRDARAIRLDVPAIPETAAGEIHVLCVSLHGAALPPWRLLEVPSAMTLDRLHEVLHTTFGWGGFGPHSFVTVYGEFFGLAGPLSRAARRARDPRDERGITLAQAAGEEGLGIVYLHGYDDEWRIDIRVEKILPAAAGVAYPRCTGGQGEDIPGDGYLDMGEFSEDSEMGALDTCFGYFDPEELTDDLADLATVIVPGS